MCFLGKVENWWDPGLGNEASFQWKKPKKVWLVEPLSKKESFVYETTKILCKRNIRGDYVSGGSYVSLAELYTKNSFKKSTTPSPRSLSSCLNKLRKVGLLTHKKEFWEDSGKFKDHIIEVVRQDIHYRIKKRSKNWIPYESDLKRWKMSFSENSLPCGKDKLLRLLKPHTGYSNICTETDADLLNGIFKHLHSRTSLRDEDGVRYVTFNYRDLEKIAWCKRSTVYRSLKKFRDLGIIKGTILTNKESKHICKITIDFIQLAKVCGNNEEIAALDILAREKNPGKRRVWCGQLCVSECEQNSGVVENEPLDFVRYLYIKDKVNIKAKNNISTRINDDVEPPDRRKSVSEPPQKTSKHVTEMKKTEDLYPKNEKKCPRINLKAVTNLVSKRFKGWFGVRGEILSHSLSGGSLKDFPVDRFADFIWDVISNSGGQDLQSPLFEGAVVPDSRLEQQWLALRFGIHCVNFLGREKFLCVHAVNNRRDGLFVVEFFDNSPRPQVGASIQEQARAALKGLHPASKPRSKERFKKLFKAKIRKQIQSTCEPDWKAPWLEKKARLHRLEKEIFQPEKLKMLKKENPELII